MIALASGLKNRVQLTTYGLHTYLDAVADALGGQIDFAALHKIYGKQGSGISAEKKYSPAERICCKKNVV